MANTFSWSNITLPPLVSVAELKAQLKITDPAFDGEVTTIGAAAQDAVLAYIGGASIDPTWSAVTVSPTVKQCIKLLATWYWNYRGDFSDDAAAGEHAKVWDAIQQSLGRHRDPTIA